MSEKEKAFYIALSISLIALAVVMSHIFTEKMNDNILSQYEIISEKIDSIIEWNDTKSGETEIITKTVFTPREVHFETDLYSIPATVTSIDRDKDFVYITDLRGEEWAFVSDLLWEIGDEITVIFDSKNTGNLDDDLIVSVNWNGEYEG